MGAGISVVGQLLGHIVYLSGDQRDEATQKRARELLVQLLTVQRALSTYPCVDTKSISNGGTDVPNGCSSCTADLMILDELVVSLSRTQVFPLVKLIFAGIKYYFDEMTPGASQTRRQSNEEGSLENDVCTATRGDGHESTASAFSAKSIFYRRLQSLNIPAGEAGRLLVLFALLLHNRVGDLTDSQAAFIISSAVKVLKMLANKALRTTFLLGVAEVGYQWPIVCLQTVISNPLPLDIHWSVVLAAVTFLPTPGQKTVFHESQSYATASETIEEPDQSQTGVSRHHLSLLRHTLQRLECAVPFENREIPVDYRPPQEGAAASALAYPSAQPSLCVKQTRFATHAWLSLINGLKLLCLPVEVTSLIDYPSAGCRADDVSAYRLMAMRASGSPTSTGLFLDGHDCQSSLRALWPCTDSRNSLPLEAKLFCHLLGQWLIALATSAVCHTPTGKSYENRSGAEAKLALNISPISIVFEGLNCFLFACGFRSTTPTNDNATGRVDGVGSEMPIKLVPEDLLGGYTEKDESANLSEFTNLIAYISSITQDLAKQRSPDYLLGLVHFFVYQLASANEMSRLAAVAVISTALSYQCLPVLTASAFGPLLDTPRASEAAPDTCLGHLLRQLSDPSPTVRLAVLSGLAHLVPSCTLSADSLEADDGDYALFHKLSEKATLPWITSTSHVTLVRRHAKAIISGLLQATDLNEDQDNPTFLLAALTSLTRLILYFQEPQLRSLFSGLSQRLLSIYIHPCDAVRETAFQLIGRLVTFAWENNRVPCVGDQEVVKLTASRLALSCEAETVFTSLVLHLNDSSARVVSACKTTLLTVAALLFGCDGMTENSNVTDSPQASNGQRVRHFLHSCVNPQSNIDLANFYNQLARMVVQHLPRKATDYAIRCTVFFRSDWPNIQCSAVLLAGSLMGQFTEEMRCNFPRAQITQELVQMFKCNNPQLRTAVASAIGRLHWF